MEDAFVESVDSVLLHPRPKRVHACKEGCSVVLKVLKAWWKLLVLVTTPFVLLPLPLAVSPLADDQVCAVVNFVGNLWCSIVRSYVLAS